MNASPPRRNIQPLFRTEEEDSPRRVVRASCRIEDVILENANGSLDDAKATLDLDARWYFACAAQTDIGGGRTHVELPFEGSTPETVANATTAALTRFADTLASELPCAVRSQGGPAASRERRS